MIRPALDRHTLKALSAKTPWPWLADAALDWAVIAAALAAATLSGHPLAFAAAWFVVGNRQHALAILGHDGTHYTLLRTRWANDALTTLLALGPLGLTASGYRNVHFRHHKHTNTADDPELAHRRLKAPQWDLPATPRTVLGYAARDLVGYAIPDYLLFLRFAVPDHRLARPALALCHGAFVALAAAAGRIDVAVLWYAALLTTFMMQFRLRTWLEHQGSDSTHRLHLTPLERLLLSPHNAWYHYEHHAWPTVPYHRLPQLRAMTPGEPVMTLTELIGRYRLAAAIPSGTPLRAAANGEDSAHVV
jgi:fatty acid desaturase